MPKTCQITLSCLLVLLPLLGNACNPKIIASTPTSRFSRFNNGTVLDKYTGLMWKACSEGQQWNAIRYTCDLFAADYTWQKALQRVHPVNSGGGFAGYKDWRVPNLKELSTLMEDQCNAINQHVVPEDPGGSWSSSTYAKYHDLVWMVDFSFTGGAQLLNQDATLSVRLVRSGQ